MSETKIKGGKVEQQTIQPDEAAVAVVEGRGHVSRRHTVRNELILAEGATGLPIQAGYMDVCYAVSPWNPGNFDDGSLVIDREVQVYKASQDLLPAIVLSYSKYYAEWRSGPSTGELKKYDTLAEAKAAGEIIPTLDRSGERPTVSPAFDFLMLVRKPANVASDKFVFKIDGHWYAYVKLSLVKGLGRDAEKALVNLCAYEAGVRGVPPGQGQANRFFIDFGLSRAKKDGKTFTNLVMRFHMKDGQPEPVPGDAIRDILSLSQTAEDAPMGDMDNPL